MTHPNSPSWVSLVGDREARALSRLRVRVLASEAVGGLGVLIGVFDIVETQQRNGFVSSPWWSTIALLLALTACFSLPWLLLGQWRVGKQISDNLRRLGHNVDGVASVTSPRSLMRWCAKQSLDPAWIRIALSQVQPPAKS